MEEKVKAFINKHRLLEKNKRVLIGVSGGPDSMALLHFFRRIQKEWNLTLLALSVDHQLRGDASRKDLEFVAKVCKEWNIPFAGTSVDVKSYRKVHRVSEEVAARHLRYRFFQEMMEKQNGDILALGHHADDQLETMLMKFSRSADSAGLSGIPVMRPFVSGKLIRPLLAVGRKEIEAYCKKQGIETRMDATNADDSYTRNFFRIHVLPLIKEKNANIHTTIQRLSETLEDDEHYLQEQAKKMVEEVVFLQENPRKATLEMDKFASRPKALQRRAFHLILNYLYEGNIPKKLSYIQMLQIFTLLESNEGNLTLDFPNQLKVSRSYNRLIFHFNEPASAETDRQTISIPGEYVLPDGNTLTAAWSATEPISAKDSYYCSKADVKLPLHIRTRKPGDRMRWKGLNGSKKIKDIFIDEKIPLEERNNWPMIVDDNDVILWLVGLKKGEPKGERGKEGPFIHLQLKREHS